jgi:hypothetical protein
MIRSRRFVALQLLALLLQLALAGTVYRVVAGTRAETVAAQARATEIAVRAAGVREYEYYRGVFSLCMSLYRDALLCNQVTAEGEKRDVYHDPRFSMDYEPSH